MPSKIRFFCDAPERREVQGPEHGAKVIELREVFGLHHRYERRAA
jgi:hypothetical protein